MMTPAEAQTYCTTLTKKSGSNFYYSFLFLPKARREAMYTVYAFCKEVDNAVDEPPPGMRLSDFDLVWASTGDGASEAPRKRMLTASQEKPTAIRLRGKIIANTPHAKI